MKGQPLAYNKDNQEDKEPLFDTVDTVQGLAARLRRRWWPACSRRRRRCARPRWQGYATATDLADYLVRKGLPFRDAHEAVARAVRAAEKRRAATSPDLPLGTLQRFSPMIGKDVYECLTLEGSVAARNHPGGTAPAQVRGRDRKSAQALHLRQRL